MKSDAERFSALANHQYYARVTGDIERGTERVRPAMLKLARESRGLLRWELARRLKVPTAAVATWESGAGGPEMFISRLVAELDYPPDFFIQDYEPIPCRICFRRDEGDDPPTKRAKPPTRDEVRAIVARVTAAIP